MIKGRIPPDDVDLFRVDADGRLFTEQRHDSIPTIDELIQGALAADEEARQPLSGGLEGEL